MKFFDYFIKDTFLRSEEELYSKRLLVMLIFLLGGSSFVIALLSFLGFFDDELNMITSVICFIVLLWYRKYDIDIVPLLIILVFGSFILVINVANTGYIYSYNNKWFVLILFLVVCIKPKWLLFLSILVVVLQSFFYLKSDLVTDYVISDNLALEEFIDNIVFYTISFGVLRLIYSYVDRKNKRLDKSNELLEAKTLQLLHSNEELERFAYVASHDLKSPLRNIVSFATLLEKDLGDKATLKQKEYLAYITGGSRKLNVIVEDVLDYSKIAKNDLKEFELIDLNEIIKEIQVLTANTIKNKSAQIIIKNTLPVVSGQKTMVLLLFKNLIENGLKYNESESPMIEILSKKEGGIMKVVVADNGIGIDEKYQKSIFHMFSRLHAESKYEGTGLGLAVCKKIVDSMGARIELKSQPGNGSEFQLLFPM